MLRISVLVFVSVLSAMMLPGCSSNPQPMAGVSVIKASLRSDFKDSVSVSGCLGIPSAVPVDTSILHISLGTCKFCGDYFFEDRSGHCILRIDTSGRVLNTIGQRGRAGGEYIGLDAFDINPASRDVSIYDMMGEKILVYSDHGEFLRSIDIDAEHEIYDDIAVFPNGNILCCQYGYQGPNGRRGVWLIDSNGCFLKQLVSVSDAYRFYIKTENFKFNRINDTLVGVAGPWGDDYIYHISSDGSVKPVFYMDFGETMSPKTLKTDLSEISSMPDSFYSKDLYAENECILWLIVHGSKDLNVLIIYDKRSGETIKIRPGMVFDIPHIVLNGSSYSRTFGVVCSAEGGVSINTYHTYTNNEN